MRARETAPAGAWQGWASWLRGRDHGGGPALLYVTCGVTSVVVLAIALLAVTELAWMVGIAFIALLLAVATLMGVIALMLTDRDGS